VKGPPAAAGLESLCFKRLYQPVGVRGLVGVIVTGATTNSVAAATVSCMVTPFVRMGAESSPFHPR
jgi:hypothetical protein